MHFVFQETSSATTGEKPHINSVGAVPTGGSPAMLSIGPIWTQVQLPFVSLGTYAAGEARARFNLGFGRQVLEIAGLSVINYAKRVRVSDLPTTTRTGYDGREVDAPWRLEAAKRIEKFRKGDLRVEVKDLSGRALPGASIHVRLRRHAFGFGSAMSAQMLTSESPDAVKHRTSVTELFNKAVLANDLKWAFWEKTETRRVTMKALEWLDSQGIEVRGHVLLWPSWQKCPADIQPLANDPA